jgi:xylose isomerase
MTDENREYFPDIRPIEYDPQASIDNLLVFKHYNQNEIILNKPMHEWLRFAVCYWHTFRGLGADMFGAPTLDRPWEQQGSSMIAAKARLRAAFEFFTKLGVKYFTFHDRDIAPEGDTIDETERNLDEIIQLAKQLQKQTGIKCLWGTANLFSHSRYMHGAATNPDAHAFAYAAAQVKKLCSKFALLHIMHVCLSLSLFVNVESGLWKSLMN